jgi:hypothetical protein
MTLAGLSRRKKKVLCVVLKKSYHHKPNGPYLSVQDDTPSLINPEVLLDETTVLEGEQAVREADEAVRRLHRASRVKRRSDSRVPERSTGFYA